MSLAIVALAKALLKALDPDLAYQITLEGYRDSIYLGIAWVNLIRIDLGLDGIVIFQEMLKAQWARTSLEYTASIEQVIGWGIVAYDPGENVKEYYLADPQLVPKLLAETRATLNNYRIYERIVEQS